MIKWATPHQQLQIFLSKLGIKSAKQKILLWDPYQNGGVGGEVEVEI